jgi:hypothetical protein
MINAVFLLLPRIILDPYGYGLKICLQKNEFPDFERCHSGLFHSKHCSIINYFEINIISLRKQKNFVARCLKKYRK